MIVPPENSISVLKQSFLFDKFAIDTSSANVRDVSSRQACHKWRKQLSEHNKPANRRTNEWFTHLSMLSPRERVGGRAWGGDFDIFFQKKIQIPHPREKKISGSKSPPGAREGAQMSFKP